MIRESATAIAIGTLLCSAGAARAQSLDYAAFEELFGEPVTTSVTGSPQRASQVPASMQIISADEIRRSGARDIPGVLRHLGGLDVLRTTNDHADVSVRGYNRAFSPRLLVLVDGRQVYADYYGFTPWSTLPVALEEIRQIEVVKGPASALFGFNAVGGVINIVTYDPLNEPVSSASLGAGTQGLAQGVGVSTFRFGDAAALRVSAGRRSNDDFSTPQTMFEAGSRRGNERETLNLNAGVRLTQSVALDFEGTYSAAEQAEFAPTLTTTYGRYETSSVKGHVAADTSAGLVEATLYRNQAAADIFFGAEAAPFHMLDNDVTIAQLKLISKVAARHTLRVSGEYRDNTVNTSPFAGADVFYDVGALGVMWEWRLTPSLTLTTAARTDRLSLGRSGAVPPGFALTNDDWNVSHTEPSYNLGLVWQAGDTDTLRFLVGRGVQLPNLLSLGGLLWPVPPFGFFAGIPTLDPSVVVNFDAGWDHALPSLGAELGLSLFHGRTSDILSDAGGFDFVALMFTPANVGRSKTSGLEVSIEATAADDWRWGASYKAQVIDDDFIVGLTPEIALSDYEHTTPRHVLDANLGWSRGPWEVDGYLRYQTDFDGLGLDELGFGATLVPIPSHVSLDARLGYALNDRMTLALSGQNITEATQRQTAAPEVERRLLATFTVQF